MKTDLTVGVFTFRRPNYLKRQLQFHQDMGKNFRSIVFDGTESDDMAGLNKKISESFGIQYVREISVQDRHHIFNEMLDTDFMAYSADDDLIFPSFYVEGERFLKENSEYSVVAGALPTLHYVRKYPWLGYYFRDFLSNRYDFHHGDLVERMVRKDQAYAMGVPPSFYGVRRSITHRTLTKYVSELKQYSSIERLENIVNFLYGGMKALDVLMGFRDYSSETIRQPQRDHPEQYICDEDIVVLQKVIFNELRDKVQDDAVLNYMASYAWPLPVRKNQTLPEPLESKYRLAIECLFNKYFSYVNNPFDSNVTRLLRRYQKELFSEQ